jgi:hypothetical protein
MYGIVESVAFQDTVSNTEKSKPVAADDLAQRPVDKQIHH